jgi:hypothetical protein
MSKILIHLKHLDPVLYPDSGDVTLFQPSDFNEGHKFTGGNDGQVLVRDVNDVTYGASWTSFPRVDGLIFSFIPPSVPVDGQAWIEVSGVSPNQITMLNIRVNGTTRTLISRTD